MAIKAFQNESRPNLISLPNTLVEALESEIQDSPERQRSSWPRSPLQIYPEQ